MNLKNNKRVYTSDALKLKATLGYFAQQANGSVWLQREGTVILATVTNEKQSTFQDFLPLSVDYREIFSATGKIPGGYFKREGKPSDREVLISRIIDRTIRPLFPENFFDKISIIITAYSIDKKALTMEMAVIAASLALGISHYIPFLGPIGCSESLKIKGKWIFNFSHQEFMESKTRAILAGDYNGINMIEGYSEKTSEEDLNYIIDTSHEKIKAQIEWQQSIISDYLENKVCDQDNIENYIKESIKKKLDNFTSNDENKALEEKIVIWKNHAESFLSQSVIEKYLFIKDKKKQTDSRKNLKKEFLELHKAQIKESEVDELIVVYAFNAVLKNILMDIIATKKQRVDGRGFDEIRPIESEVGLLPCTHGSGMFTRGETQVLSTTTLGSDSDVLKLDTVIDEPVIPFMLHYNFLPFSVGEARNLRHLSRREVGHGFLAQNAIKAILPETDGFPYSIRIVSDVISCNGSSSMATVCSGVLSLLDAGVPLKDMISGVAMGIIADNKNNFHILTDIAGIEDELGLMDLKITGNEKFVTAIQMDIKYKSGLPKELIIEIFKKAKEARIHILKKMKEVISRPQELSKNVPRCINITIPKGKIGAVIGSSGKIIKQITEKTETQINIEDSGIVKVFGTPGENFDKAIFWIKIISGQIFPGDTCYGIIKKIVDFGFFVEIAPHCDGLVHISTLPKQKQASFRANYKEGAEIQVKILEYDSDSNRIRLEITQ